jgi:predicted nucleotidyltransferase
MLEQWNAVSTLVPYLKRDPAVRAIFLKGSLARGDGDAYSDVDLYCLVHEQELERFLGSRLEYLKQYKELLYWSEANFVGPQIVAVFANGLHLDLYTVTASTLQQTDAVKVLYDPEGLLADFHGSFFEVSKAEVVRTFGSLTFSLLEFETAYKRGNLVWASRLASHISGDLVLMLRHIYDPEHAQVGFKKINDYLPEYVYGALSDALDGISPTNLPVGLLKLLELLEDAIPLLPVDVRDGLNMPFYDFMAARIRSLG